MADNLQIYCKNTRSYIDVKGGETLLEIFGRIDIPDMIQRPICAHVNNKNEGLDFPVYTPKQVEFLDRTSSSGRRVYIRSLCMMLYKAVRDTMPGTTLVIEHSVSRGFYCRLSRNDAHIPVTPAIVSSLLDRMKQIADDDIPFSRHEQLTSEVIDKFVQQGLADKVQLLSTINDLYTTYYRLDDTIDSYYGCLAPSTGYIDTFNLVPYMNGFLLLPFDLDNPSVPAVAVVQEKMFQAFTDHLEFNQIIGVRTVGELNETIAAGHSAMIVNVAEALHERNISAIAADIAQRFHHGGARVVLIAGPSSSGKTTFTKRLSIHLLTNLLKPQMISLDDYFVNREDTPRDQNGEYDFESLYSLDLELFNRDLNLLIDGRTVEIPYYNFETGRREFRGNFLKLDPRSILLIEGIHGLNPELTALVDEQMKYRVYVSALTTLSIDNHNWVPTTDNRLLRRVIRDFRYRGADAAKTLRMWPNVRRGEERWIFPFQENADATFNSSLIFELSVMRDFAENVLRTVPHDIPEYAEANRLRRFLSYFNPIDRQITPSTSLLREFLGGSSFHY